MNLFFCKSVHFYKLEVFTKLLVPSRDAPPAPLASWFTVPLLLYIIFYSLLKNSKWFLYYLFFKSSIHSIKKFAGKISNKNRVKNAKIVIIFSEIFIYSFTLKSKNQPFYFSKYFQGDFPISFYFREKKLLGQIVTFMIFSRNIQFSMF